MIDKLEFAKRLRQAVDEVVSARPGEIEARIKQLQQVMDGDFPLIEDLDEMGETRYMLESAQMFMNIFASKEQKISAESNGCCKELPRP